MQKLIEQMNNTPWKVFNEIYMYILKIPLLLYAFLCGIEVDSGSRFYGLPRFFKFRGSKIKFGKRFENRNIWDSNPIGINHPTIFCTWSKNASIKIGDDVGMSGGAIIAATKIEIGDGTLIGANSTIIDTNFHPLKSTSRRYSTTNIKTSPIIIGKNVFIGMNTIILNGAIIPDNSIIPAGSIVRKPL